jgi:5-methyltetrahydropteroyltriglutamate--homocysteine methyltransferase
MANFPHRADMVGSLLRPSRLAAARQSWKDGRLAADELRTIEDEEIAAVVSRLEEIGIGAVTDGEFRRDWWHLDFFNAFDGVELAARPRPANFKGEGESPPIPVITGRVRHARPIFVDAFSFLASVTTKRIPKLTMPGPGVATLMGGRTVVDEETYPDMEAFWVDLVAGYRDEIADLYQAGCRYLQLDDISFAYLCDPNFRDQIAARGDDPDQLLRKYRDTTNEIIAGRPDDLLVTTHMCRGNFRSRWVASGGYQPIAELVFGGMDVDAFFLEFDSERAGGFEPLRHLATDKTVVLGLITSKTPELEDADEIKRRIDEAAAIVPLDRLALSPQCGFSSSHHGNELTADDQWRKLELVVAVAEDVWG